MVYFLFKGSCYDSGLNREAWVQSRIPRCALVCRLRGLGFTTGVVVGTDVEKGLYYR